MKRKIPKFKLNYRAFPDYYQAQLLKKIPPIKFRWDWGALPPKEPEEYQPVPAAAVIITYTGGEECQTEEECLRVVKATQVRDTEERGLPDIQYNFYIGNDGKIYEGKGWMAKSTKDPEFQHLYGTSIDIAYMGDFSDKEPPVKVVKMANFLIQYMSDHRLLKDEYETIPLEKCRELKVARITQQ